MGRHVQPTYRTRYGTRKLEWMVRVFLYLDTPGIYQSSSSRVIDTLGSAATLCRSLSSSSKLITSSGMEVVSCPRWSTVSHGRRGNGGGVSPAPASRALAAFSRPWVDVSQVGETSSVQEAELLLGFPFKLGEGNDGFRSGGALCFRARRTSSPGAVSLLTALDWLSKELDPILESEMFRFGDGEGLWFIGLIREVDLLFAGGELGVIGLLLEVDLLFAGEELGAIDVGESALVWGEVKALPFGDSSTLDACCLTLRAAFLAWGETPCPSDTCCFAHRRLAPRFCAASSSLSLLFKV